MDDGNHCEAENRDNEAAPNGAREDSLAQTPGADGSRRKSQAGEAAGEAGEAPFCQTSS